MGLYAISISCGFTAFAVLWQGRFRMLYEAQAEVRAPCTRLGWGLALNLGFWEIQAQNGIIHKKYTKVSV